MNFDGELTLRLDVRHRRVAGATVLSTRPFATSRVLAGRGAREAAAMVPALHGVCAFAQGAAAASALACAEGRTLPDAVLAARSLAVALEAVQEDLRRLLIDVPAGVGLAPSVEPVATVRRAIAPMLAALRPALALDATASAPAAAAVATLGERLLAVVEAAVLDTGAGAFVATSDADALIAWTGGASLPARVVRTVLDEAPALGASDVRPLPEADAADLASGVLAALDGDPAFARAPRWRGAVAETGALARCASHAGIAAIVQRHGHGVAARLLARCVDLARTVASLAAGRVEPRVLAWSPSRGEGVAAVHAARGLLVHRSRVADGRVVEHAIVAPTEWNFHPDGALARGVAGLAADDEARLVRDAMLVAQSLDPCVACIVEVAHA